MLPTKQRGLKSFFLIIAFLGSYWLGKYVAHDEAKREKEKTIICSPSFWSINHNDTSFDMRNIVQQLRVVQQQLEYGASHKTYITTTHTNRISEIISRLDLRYNIELTQRKSTEVCPESYKGVDQGWLTDRCTYAKPINELIEVLLYYPECNKRQMVNVLTGIRRQFSTLTVRVAVSGNKKNTCYSSAIKLSGVEVITVKNTSAGTVWNKLVSAVSTPYGLVGRNLDGFDGKFSSFERQIRVLGIVKDAQVVGGAVRNKSSFWRVGCYQMDVRNYALTYKDGYYSSRNECMFCNYLLGPFVARISLLRKVPFDESLPATMLFEDWFLQIQTQQVNVLNCPDVMYFASDSDADVKGAEPKLWIPLARKWEFNEITWPSSQTHVFTCEETRISCEVNFERSKYYLIPPCCLEQMAHNLRIIDQILSEHNVTYKLICGAVLAAVKMADFIPWDLDFDISQNWDLDNNWEYVKKTFLRHGLTLAGDKHDDYRRLFPSAKVSVTGSFFFELLSDNWDEGFKKSLTKVNIHGVWVYGPENPGLDARNRYGIEVLKHVQNWRTLRKPSENSPYIAGHFNKCPKPKHHSCLDHFLPDGSLGFKGT